jgi:hypothetical protein
VPAIGEGAGLGATVGLGEGDAAPVGLAVGPAETPGLPTQADRNSMNASSNRLRRTSLPPVHETSVRVDD